MKTTTTEHLLEAALDDTPDDHRLTLFGERKFGSKWGQDFTMDDWVTLLPWWREFQPPEEVRNPACRYFRAYIRDVFPTATLGAMPYGEMTSDEQARVQEVEGAHGAELHCRCESGTLARRLREEANHATLILGPLTVAEDSPLVIFTMHPGDPLAPHKAGEEPTLWTAVKIIEGELS